MAEVVDIDKANERVRGWIRQGTSFVRGKLWGRDTREGLIRPGKLPLQWRWVLEDIRPDYVVSYDDTPIAWHYIANPASATRDVHRWVIPSVSYDRATTRAQRIARDALVLVNVIQSLDDERLR